MKPVAELKTTFALTAEDKGYITKQDYYKICAGVTDTKVLEDIADWIISRGFILRDAIGQQYKQEILEKAKHPNIENVKDTKHRTHKNKDKVQESKKDVTTATLNLNNLITDMKDMETEYFPAWKKFKASKKTVEDCDEFFKIAVVYGYPRDMQAMVQALLDSAQGQFDPSVTLGQLAPGAGLSSFIVNYTIGDLLQGRLAEIEDSDALKNIYEGLRSYLENALPGQDERQPPMEQPQEFEPDFGTDESLDLGASKTASVEVGNVIYFENGAKFSVDIAETVLEKAAGLEVKDALKDSEGMFFPFDPPENVTFHMGKVKFPIDILFLMNDGNKMKVGKVIHNVEPGSDDRWSFQKASAVLELVGGMCATCEIKEGSVCSFDKVAYMEDATEAFTDFVNNNEGAHSVAFETVQDIIAEDAFPIGVVTDETLPQFPHFFDELTRELEQTFMDANLWAQLDINPEDVSWRGFAEMVLLWYAQERL